jgi:hypothetical protein
MPHILTQQISDIDIDLQLTIQSEIEQENREEAEQIYAQELFSSEAEHVKQHATDGVADSLGALATPQWFTHKVDGVIPQQLMFNLADERGDEVYVGSDVPGAPKGTKKFVSSGKHAHLATKVLKCSVGASPCTLYEMIRENMPCKFFLDVEWEESEFSGYTRLDSVYEAVYSKFMVSLYSLNR